MDPFDPRLPIIAQDARVKPCHVFHCVMAIKAMGKQFHAKAFARFAGIEERHAERIMAALEAHDALPAKRTGGKRGVRLEDDFSPPKEWIDWAVRKRKWEPSVAYEEAENFAAYWQAKSGKDAAKLDWFKTWQNWVRNSRREDGLYSVKSERSPEQHIEYCEARLRAAKDADWRQGIQEWTERLNEARSSALGNVVPIKRA